MGATEIDGEQTERDLKKFVVCHYEWAILKDVTPDNAWEF